MDSLFPIALKNLPTPTLIVDGKRPILFANIKATNVFNTIIGKDLALTFRHPDVLYTVDRTLASKTTESIVFLILGLLAQIFKLHTIPVLYGPSASFVLLSLQDKTKAIRSDEMRADFIANASHELRTPLSAILGFIETLKGPASDDTEARVKFLEIMGREAVRMNRLIDDLIQLSQVEIDEHVHPSWEIDLATTIHHFLKY